MQQISNNKEIIKQKQIERLKPIFKDTATIKRVKDHHMCKAELCEHLEKMKTIELKEKYALTNDEMERIVAMESSNLAMYKLKFKETLNETLAILCNKYIDESINLIKIISIILARTGKDSTQLQEALDEFFQGIIIEDLERIIFKASMKEGFRYRIYKKEANIEFNFNSPLEIKGLKNLYLIIGIEREFYKDEINNDEIIDFKIKEFNQLRDLVMVKKFHKNIFVLNLKEIDKIRKIRVLSDRMNIQHELSVFFDNAEVVYEGSKTIINPKIYKQSLIGTVFQSDSSVALDPKLTEAKERKLLHVFKINILAKGSYKLESTEECTYMYRMKVDDQLKWRKPNPVIVNSTGIKEENHNRGHRKNEEFIQFVNELKEIESKYRILNTNKGLIKIGESSLAKLYYFASQKLKDLWKQCVSTTKEFWKYLHLDSFKINEYSNSNEEMYRCEVYIKEEKMDEEDDDFRDRVSNFLDARFRKGADTHYMDIPKQDADEFYEEQEVVLTGKTVDSTSFVVSNNDNNLLDVEIRIEQIQKRKYLLENDVYRYGNNNFIVKKNNFTYRIEKTNQNPNVTYTDEGIYYIGNEYKCSTSYTQFEMTDEIIHYQGIDNPIYKLKEINFNISLTALNAANEIVKEDYHPLKTFNNEDINIPLIKFNKNFSRKLFNRGMITFALPFLHEDYLDLENKQIIAYRYRKIILFYCERIVYIVKELIDQESNPITMYGSNKFAFESLMPLQFQQKFIQKIIYVHKLKVGEIIESKLEMNKNDKVLTNDQIYIYDSYTKTKLGYFRTFSKLFSFTAPDTIKEGGIVDNDELFNKLETKTTDDPLIYRKKNPIDINSFYFDGNLILIYSNAKLYKDLSSVEIDKYESEKSEFLAKYNLQTSEEQLMVENLFDEEWIKKYEENEIKRWPIMQKKEKEKMIYSDKIKTEFIKLKNQIYLFYKLQFKFTEKTIMEMHHSLIQQLIEILTNNGETIAVFDNPKDSEIIYDHLMDATIHDSMNNNNIHLIRKKKINKYIEIKTSLNIVRSLDQVMKRKYENMEKLITCRDGIAATKALANEMQNTFINTEGIRFIDLITEINYYFSDFRINNTSFRENSIEEMRFNMNATEIINIKPKDIPFPRYIQRKLDERKELHSKLSKLELKEIEEKKEKNKIENLRIQVLEKDENTYKATARVAYEDDEEEEICDDDDLLEGNFDESSFYGSLLTKTATDLGLLSGEKHREEMSIISNQGSICESSRYFDNTGNNVEVKKVTDRDIEEDLVDFYELLFSDKRFSMESFLAAKEQNKNELGYGWADDDDLIDRDDLLYFDPETNTSYTLKEKKERERIQELENDSSTEDSEDQSEIIIE